ncbi:hypothetical protein D9613_001180 [Agrocybe pediades]|uniref:Uncharacterized protein n=1 Tax=Agrocybe pediades TaxID=84607 RepID=A0A8H4QZJ0_9AGAR|nr:hypothetical protein D9613_001180 [Agrocybe pediades]
MPVSQNVNLERSLYYGVIFMCIFYGLEIYMFAHSLSVYLNTSPRLRRQRRVYIIIGTISLALTTAVVFTDAVFMEFMWIEHRDVEGGPLGYLVANSSIWWQTMGTAANQLTNYIGDGLLLLRCYIIWRGTLWAIVVPGLLYIGSIAMGVVTLVQSAIPGANFFQGAPVNFGVPWASLSVSLNIIVTGLISYQLLSARHQLKKTLPAESLQMYTGVTAILVESALPFSLMGIVFAVTYGKNMDVGPAFLFVWATLCALCPQFIIFRVVMGRSWTQDMVQYATNTDARTGPIITFSTNPGYDLDSMDNNYRSASEPSHATSTTLSQMSVSPSMMDTSSKAFPQGSDRHLLWPDKPANHV